LALVNNFVCIMCVALDIVSYFEVLLQDSDRLVRIELLKCLEGVQCQPTLLTCFPFSQRLNNFIMSIEPNIKTRLYEDDIPQLYGIEDDFPPPCSLESTLDCY